jgi:hypothetical protein
MLSGQIQDLIYPIDHKPFVIYHWSLVISSKTQILEQTTNSRNHEREHDRVNVDVDVHVLVDVVGFSLTPRLRNCRHSCLSTLTKLKRMCQHPLILAFIISAT